MMVGLGQVYPGSSCYDNSHDAGMVHCASTSSVIASAFNPSVLLGSTPDFTTDCSSQEQSCIAQTPSAAGANAPGVAATDPCSQAIGMPCTTVFLGGIAVILLLAVISATMGGRRR